MREIIISIPLPTGKGTTFPSSFKVDKSLTDEEITELVNSTFIKFKCEKTWEDKK